MAKAHSRKQKASAAFTAFRKIPTSQQTGLRGSLQSPPTTRCKYERTGRCRRGAQCSWWGWNHEEGAEEACSCPLLPQAQRLVKEAPKRVAPVGRSACRESWLPLSCLDSAELHGSPGSPCSLGNCRHEKILARTQQIRACGVGTWSLVSPCGREVYESQRLKSTEMPGKKIENITLTPSMIPSPLPQPSELEKGLRSFPRLQMEEHRA